VNDSELPSAQTEATASSHEDATRRHIAEVERLLGEGCDPTMVGQVFRARKAGLSAEDSFSSHGNNVLSNWVAEYNYFFPNRIAALTTGALPVGKANIEFAIQDLKRWSKRQIKTIYGTKVVIPEAVRTAMRKTLAVFEAVLAKELPVTIPRTEAQNKAVTNSPQRYSLPEVPETLKQRFAAGFLSGCYGDKSPWNKGNWAQTFPTEPLLSVVPWPLGRRQAVELFHKLISAEDIRGAFIVMNLWGQQLNGGTRTAAMLSGKGLSGKGKLTEEQVIARLKHSVELAVSGPDGVNEAYRYLNNNHFSKKNPKGAGHIPSLGWSFFTKWLYFATAKGNPYAQGATPILDKVVREWFFSNTQVNLNEETIANYELYCEILGSWAASAHEHGAKEQWTPAMIEETIFDLEKGRWA